MSYKEYMRRASSLPKREIKLNTLTSKENYSAMCL